MVIVNRLMYFKTLVKRIGKVEIETQLEVHKVLDRRFAP
jgi:hypothetical protein